MAADEQIVAAVLIIAAIVIGWLIFSGMPDSQSMVPMYYGPYSSDPNAAPRVSAWQQYTQGGLPNPIIGRGPLGQPIGAYDYLGRNLDGYNAVPGSMVFPEFQDCGCGCGGAQAALKAGACPATAAAIGAANKAAAAGSQTVNNSNVSKSMPCSAIPSGPTAAQNKIAHFGGASMANIRGGMCSQGAVAGGRSDCSGNAAAPGLPMADANSAIWAANGNPAFRTVTATGIAAAWGQLAPSSTQGSGVVNSGSAASGVRSMAMGKAAKWIGMHKSTMPVAHFGASPMAWEHDPTYRCQKGSVVGGSSDCSGSGFPARGYSSSVLDLETQMAIAQIPTAAATSTAAFTAAQQLATQGSTLDKPPINAHMDSRTVSPRTPLPGGVKNPSGQNQVSGFDHRRRVGA